MFLPLDDGPWGGPARAECLRGRVSVGLGAQGKDGVWLRRAEAGGRKAMEEAPAASQL